MNDEIKAGDWVAPTDPQSHLYHQFPFPAKVLRIEDDAWVVLEGFDRPSDTYMYFCYTVVKCKPKMLENE